MIRRPMLPQALRALCITGFALSAMSASTAQAQLLTFDDVTTNASGFNSTAFGSYGGYVFENWGVMTTSAPGTGTNAVSGTKFAFAQADGSSFIYRNNPAAFHLFGAFLSFRQLDLLNPDNSPVSITVNGYRAGEFDPAFTSTIMVTNTAQFFPLNFTNIEEVEFVTSELQAGDRSSVLAMDNAQLAVVPEPSTWLLVLIGLSGVLIVANRRAGRRV